MKKANFTQYYPEGVMVKIGKSKDKVHIVKKDNVYYLEYTHNIKESNIKLKNKEHKNASFSDRFIEELGEYIETEHAGEEKERCQGYLRGVIERHYPEWTKRPIPETAPARWADDKHPDDTPITFIQRHYGEWLNEGLTRPDIKRLDPRLYTALSNWLRNPANELPDDFGLKTLKEHNDAWVQRVEEGKTPISGHLEIQRYAAARRNRIKHQIS